MLLSCLNFSIKYTTQGNKAKAKISGFKTNLIAIEGGKKLTNINIIKINMARILNKRNLSSNTFEIINNINKS